MKTNASECPFPTQIKCTARIVEKDPFRTNTTTALEISSTWRKHQFQYLEFGIWNTCT